MIVRCEFPEMDRSRKINRKKKHLPSLPTSHIKTQMILRGNSWSPGQTNEVRRCCAFPPIKLVCALNEAAILNALNETSSPQTQLKAIAQPLLVGG